MATDFQVRTGILQRGKQRMEKKRSISPSVVPVTTQAGRGRPVKGFAFWSVKRKIHQRYQEVSNIFSLVFALVAKVNT